MKPVTYGLGIETAKAIRSGRAKQYTTKLPEVFEQLSIRDLISIMKMKALRVESFNETIDDTVSTNLDEINKQYNKIGDELTDIINYSDMIFCKMSALQNELKEEIQND